MYALMKYFEFDQSENRYMRRLLYSLYFKKKLVYLEINRVDMIVGHNPLGRIQ